MIRRRIHAPIPEMIRYLPQTRRPIPHILPLPNKIQYPLLPIC